MFEQRISEVTNQKFTSKTELITYLAGLAKEAGKINELEPYVKAVLKREEVVSTAVGYHVAIPHGESDAVKETFVACLKLTHPIDWNGMETTLVFMIGVPLANRDKEHIKILAMLSRSLMREEFRTRLCEAKNSETFYQIIKELERN
ncbi:MAG: PTS sugar transporter subunit IIA [Erysipelotrichia bacterium]|nr:PTS sugar transporter subunit IIA [Erysipelotrichia bacterium]NCC54921.1 PTS sugar transporter subunit IIA [Erysipelotrichia bacterium]